MLGIIWSPCVSLNILFREEILSCSWIELSVCQASRDNSVSLCFRSIWVIILKCPVQDNDFPLYIDWTFSDFPLLVSYQLPGKLLFVHFLPNKLVSISDLDQMASWSWCFKQTRFSGCFCGSQSYSLYAGNALLWLTNQFHIATPTPSFSALSPVDCPCWSTSPS